MPRPIPKLIFASQNRPFLDEITKLLPTATIHYGDVEKLAYMTHAAFVSPANSLGFMDGGIDMAYSRTMFPGVEPRVKQKIRSIGHLDFIERPYLPIGSAIIVPANSAKSQWLISAPTMLLPQPVQTTRNAYWATLATLRVWEKFTVACQQRTGKSLAPTIIFTSFCCGVGAMSSVTSAKQMHAAIQDWISTKETPDTSTYADVYFNEPCLAEQPDLYENLDFKRGRKDVTTSTKLVVMQK